jgi:phage tail-like protein
MTMPADTVTANRFSLAMDGNEIASFSDLGGITAEVESVPYLESNDQEVRYNQLPGKAKPPMIVLKRVMNRGMELSAWHDAVRKGQMDAARRSCTLTMYADGKPVAKYWLEQAWPTKLDISAMKAGSSAVMYETVTLVCEYIQRVSP